MSHSRATGAAWAVVALMVGSCSSPSGPAVPDGRIVFRFLPTPAPSASAPGAAAAAATFDSVAIRVFRGGAAIVLETVRGAPVLGTEPVEVAIPCIAENGKRVSVELFEMGVMSYHGADPDVDVPAGRRTSVVIDAYPFAIDTLAVTPVVVYSGSAFSLRWGSAAAAAWYQVQSSATPDFATIDWQQAVLDTVLDTMQPPGSHYFRVIPMTDFAPGTPAGPGFGYVVSGSGSVDITGLSPGAAIPGETFTIVGENLDLPGTRAWIGVHELSIESARWDSLLVRVPRAATTAQVSVVSPGGWLGSDTSDDPLVVQRVAYVTDGATFAPGYLEALADHADDFGYSGVAVVPVEELDWREMGVFDVIIVAEDTGRLPAQWGGGQPGRAAAILFTNANVLAMGTGGAVFLQIVSNMADFPQQTTDDDGTYYAPDTAAEVFTTPHSVSGPDIAFAAKSSSTTTLQISSTPAGVNLYASSDKSCLFLVCSDNDRWVLGDFRFQSPGGVPVVYFFWGYGDDPKELTSDGSNCLGNVMHLLYGNRVVTPAVSSSAR
jgi:hypothetical protein